MPWHVGKSDECPGDEPWAVIKDDDGEVVGCHETKEDAQAQLTALQINVEHPGRAAEGEPGWLIKDRR